MSSFYLFSHFPKILFHCDVKQNKDYQPKIISSCNQVNRIVLWLTYEPYRLLIGLFFKSGQFSQRNRLWGGDLCAGIRWPVLWAPTPVGKAEEIGLRRGWGGNVGQYYWELQSREGPAGQYRSEARGLVRMASPCPVLLCEGLFLAEGNSQRGLSWELGSRRQVEGCPGHSPQHSPHA